LIGSDGTRLFAGSGISGLFRSQNSGVSWQPANSGIKAISDSFYSPISSMLAIGTSLYLANGDDIYISNNQANDWTPIHAGITATIVNDLRFMFNQIFIATQSNGIHSYEALFHIFQSYDNLPIPTRSILSIGKANNHMLLGTLNHGLFITSDGGDTWSQGGTLPGSYWSISRILAADTLIYILCNNQIYRSDDDGQTWTDVNNGLPAGGSKVLAVLDGSVFCGYSTGGLYRSDNQGNQWNLSDQGLAGIGIKSLQANHPYLFAGTIDHGVYRSRDLGETWIKAGEELDGMTIYPMMVGGSNLFARNIKNRLFYSPDNGANWHDAGYDSSNCTIMCLETDSHYLYLGTAGGPLWSRALMEMEECLVISLPDHLIAAPGDTITIPIQVPDLTGKRITSFRLTLDYDPDLLSYLDIIKTECIPSGFTIQAIQTQNGKLEVEGSGEHPLIGSGTLMLIRCVSSDLSGHSCNLDLSDVEFNTGIPCVQPCNGSFEIFRCQTGDVTRDGTIGAYDASRILRHSVGLDTLPDYMLECAETNCNSTINAQDAAVVLFYTVGRISELPHCGLLPTQSPAQTSDPLDSDPESIMNIKIGCFKKTGVLQIPLSVSAPIGSPITSIQFDLQYDPAQLEFIQISFPPQSQENWVKAINHHKPGQLRFAAASLPSAENNDTLLLISFNPCNHSINPESYRIDNFILNGSIPCDMVSIPDSDPLYDLNHSGSDPHSSHSLSLTHYPNPFNRQTTIEYHLPEASPVTITLYDLTGKTHYRRHFPEQPAGIHQLDFTAPSLSSGVYLISLQTRQQRLIRKMILLQ
ncbi:MAG: T9SS type A sorting domain-containing protein, partial [Candidatus Delongbacteria bacterium]|nr:T9SS type A sorting domain-containing protein [Candidatus Delongbacteria bacterium]